MAVDPNAPTQWVEVAYATPDKQAIVRLEVPVGCTVAQAIERSRIREQFPGMVVDANAVGIFARKVALDDALREGDRVEIYRPLIVDPKESRRKRAAQPGKRKAADSR
jgi:putative ubiquitin-RnfH superfamily antitoxin RatB of RatAB toxin-antitoxin module